MVIVGIELPVILKLGALVTEPPVVPNTNVCVAGISDLNPAYPCPVAGLYDAVHENPVAVAILNTVVAAVVCVRLINGG